MSLRRELFDILPVHAFFLEHILLNPHFLQYPPSDQYQKTFWKWAIYHLENMAPIEDFEIDPRIYQHYLTWLPSSGLSPGSARPDHRDELCPQGLPLQKPPAPSYVTHFWKPPQATAVQDDQSSLKTIQLNEYETITLLESRTTIESGTTGLRTWLASFMLSQYLTKHSDVLVNKRILELGSGVGFLGIIIARLQQLSSKSPDAPLPTLWLTDVNETVLSRCQDNVRMSCNRSSSSSNINYRLIDWTDSQHFERVVPLRSLIQHEINADLILGADIIFDPSLIPALTGVLHLALQLGHSASPKTALIAATVRNEQTLDLFLHAAQEQGLQVRELSKEADQTAFMQEIDSDAGESVKIFHITTGT
ncbi:putative lysine methyltransferase [Lyophyllum shimeji]|uniref:Lysine methyltransferase n=1 Tax=Lyophyllum shimeji TaxID=47721 RepID=A0A9P3UUU3_LYOSH|nr:putative lysine methyltransferase [Lyophyllum shimeji]